jgi:hypothetical protein
VPVGAVIVIVPVATVQVGCVRLTVGAAGVAGWTFIKIFGEDAEVQPSELVTVYE